MVFQTYSSAWMISGHMVEIPASGFREVVDDFTAIQLCIVIIINEKGLEDDEDFVNLRWCS